MLNTTTNNTVILRNYIILTATVMFTAMGLTDTFLAPTRVGQQDRINNFGQVVSAGLVSYSQTLGR
ncbi:hypothetical protein cce_2212 [Crocosphaera subtropica ATCC 51142]|uniref:Uncharacterized protein n=1 Tax=Crocosphaera subtropica (strain ATCC 51142 / BH68) TaxID=43989 RepID=B1WPJ2_CROS5|nr:hypothetical protein [Crocosphaera subtropica]ACB51562.1 hypothetical protein cce_2212 [Crocosphaera subtropica ATCC 51142]